MPKNIAKACVCLFCLSMASLSALDEPSYSSASEPLADVVELPPAQNVKLRQCGTVSFPIEISLDEIQALVNEKVPESFDKDRQPHSLSSVVKGGWIDYHIQRGPIALTPLSTPNGDVLGFDVPLNGTCSAGGKFLKIMPASVGLDFRGSLIGSIRAGLKADWTPDVQTAFVADLDKGNLKLFKTFHIQVRDHLEDELQKRRPELEKKLLKQLDLLDIPHRIQPYWAQLYKTIRLSRNPPAWIQFKPHSLALGSLRLSKDRRVLLDVQVETEAVTFLGEKPPEQDVGALPRLGRIHDAASAFKISVPSYVSLSTVGQFLEKQFLPINFNVNKEISVTFRKLSFDGDGSQVKCSIEAEAHGGVFGDGLPVTLNATVLPKLDAEKRELRFENLKYTVETETFLAKSASALLEPIVLAKLQEKAHFAFSDLLERSREKVNQIMADKKANKHVQVSAHFEKMDVCDLFLHGGQIVIVSSAEGALCLKVHP
jgi:hypothetical protein